MIGPGKNGRRSGSVAKGRCEAGCFAKNGRPLVRWILNHETSVREARGRRVQNPETAAANAVAEHLRERFEEPAQTDLVKPSWRWARGKRRRAIHVAPRPERRLIPPSPQLMDAGISSAVGWINLTTLLLRRFASFGRAALQVVVLPFRLR